METLWILLLCLIAPVTGEWSFLKSDATQAVLGPAREIPSINGPVLDHNFPDPALVHIDNVWYAFATNNAPWPRPYVQVATSWDFETWTLNSFDPLLTTGPWAVGNKTWAPSVIQRPDGDWVLFYTNPPKVARQKHCVAVAISPNLVGPYIPASSEPLICDLTAGGAIDPAAFRNADGTYWLVYKVDGNSIGHGGACMNDVAPIEPTPIMLQRLADDLITFVDDPVQLITNDGPEDGPDVEAPDLVRSDEGVYFLFYSSNCFTSPHYNIAYATAENITGPYVRRGTLLKTGDLGLIAPGGAGFAADGKHFAFHADCPQGRCLYTGLLKLNGTHASI